MVADYNWVPLYLCNKTVGRLSQNTYSMGGVYKIWGAFYIVIMGFIWSFMAVNKAYSAYTDIKYMYFNLVKSKILAILAIISIGSIHYAAKSGSNMSNV